MAQIDIILSLQKHYWIGLIIATCFFLSGLIIISRKNTRDKVNLRAVLILFFIYSAVFFADMLSTMNCVYIMDSIEPEQNIILKYLFYRLGWYAFPVYILFSIMIIISCLITTNYVVVYKMARGIKKKYRGENVRIICFLFWVLFWVFSTLLYISVPINNFKVC